MNISTITSATGAHPSARRKFLRVEAGFSLVEILVVVGILTILAAIAMVNFRRAVDRALKSTDAANLHAIGTALQSYLIDYDTLPPADREAGPFMSHTEDFVAVANGPAGGGSWDGIPWLLYEKGYVSRWETLFCPKYLKLYRGGSTIRGGHPRFHNFRYAYNSSALSSGGHLGGAGNVMSGTVWIVRDLWLPADQGFFAGQVPDPPADFTFPWGEGDWVGQLELVFYSDMAVRTVIGGEDKAPPGPNQ